mmetsp:Transcript_11323/g.35802  ORF Transcript_11323/g.35802 Transcript_11323/m.35802 type:complete len:200 (-) Transcript_11323:594-1193(-)
MATSAAVGAPVRRVRPRLLRRGLIGGAPNPLPGPRSHTGRDDRMATSATAVALPRRVHPHLPRGLTGGAPKPLPDLGGCAGRHRGIPEDTKEALPNGTCAQRHQDLARIFVSTTTSQRVKLVGEEEIVPLRTWTPPGRLMQCALKELGSLTFGGGLVIKVQCDLAAATRMTVGGMRRSSIVPLELLRVAPSDRELVRRL